MCFSCVFSYNNMLNILTHYCAIMRREKVKAFVLAKSANFCSMNLHKWILDEMSQASLNFY